VLKVLIGWECGHETSGEILGDPRDIVRVSGHVVLADIGHCRIGRRDTHNTRTHTDTRSGCTEARRSVRKRSGKKEM
jgi:hypothetical protein